MVANYMCKPDHLSHKSYYLLLRMISKKDTVFRINIVLVLVSHIVGLVVTSPVMEVEVVSLIPA